MDSMLESGSFPVELVNIASAREKGPGRPPFWEMVFWWTRKPLASARAVILASLLPQDFSLEKFIRIVYPSYEGRGRFSKTPHYLNPNTKLLDKELYEKIKKARLLDPFAGFGSIPLEAVRLGLGEVVASELLPTAVVFLRAILEYPKWAVERNIERKLVEDVEKWGRWIIEELGKDPDVKDLYDPDTAVYIGTWEVKCPFCGKYTPLVGNWWLARFEGKRGFENLAWMTPVKTAEGVEIRVEQVKDPGKLQSARLIKSGNRTVGVEVNGEKHLVGDPELMGEPNIDARNNEATCLNCQAKLKGSRDKWHVKEALRDWNNRLEKYLNGDTTLEELRQAPARPRLLVKVKVKATSKDLEFEPTSMEENEKLWKALEKLKQMWGDPDLPTELLPSYDKEFARTHIWGFDNFYKLFNPRQLLTLVKLVKLIREAGKKIEEEKLREGWNKEDAHKYAEAVTTYLAMALIEHARYNSVVASWNSTSWAESKIRDALSFRGIAMVWNFVEVPIHEQENIMYSYAWSVKTEVDSLSYLISAVSGSPSRVRVVHDDATVLSKLGDEKFDLIVTDPPYRDDVAYAELSDFYYVWLKRALSDSNGVSLSPRFHSDVFFPGGVEVPTQWQWFASREVSLSEGRFEYFGMASEKKSGDEVYKDLLKASFKSMFSRLGENGLLVTYFAQSSPEAWTSLIEAGLDSGLYPATAFPVLTESEVNIVARGKAAISASIVVAWRKMSKDGPLDVSSRYDELVEEAVKALKSVEETLSRASAGVASGLYGVTIFVMAYAKVLGLLTRNGKPVKAGRVLSAGEVAGLGSEILVRAYAREAGARLSSNDSMFYYVVKRVFPSSPEGRRLASSSDLILISHGVTPSEKEKALDDYVRRKILKAYGREEETEVASRKTYILIEPARADELELSQVLKAHGVDPDNPSTFKSPVHVLHALMLYSLKPREVFTKYYEKAYLANPSLTTEAVELAKALSTLNGGLSDPGGGDPEAVLSERILEYLGAYGSKTRGRRTLYDYANR